MKGYLISSGFMGFVPDEGYRLFETEDAYYDWKRECVEEDS
jgi:hypothetical protein